ncbi:MAG: hypothetical protein ACK527_00680 [Acidobacteriota bacterium]
MTGTVILAVAISLAAIGVITIRGQRQLGKHRGVTRDEFIRAFPSVPASVSGSVFDYYKSQVWAKEFSIGPEDSYEHVLSEGDEEIDDDVQELVKRLGFSMPANYAVRRSETSIKSVKDMVHWLDWVRQHQSA